MAQPFIHDDFLLSSEPARQLYHDFAAGQPIVDFHNHLSPRDLAQNRRYADLAELWLAGDHYKWRAMRAAGVPERLITGPAAPREKFDAWVRTVPLLLRSPLYHWTHLELARFFDIQDLLNPRSADAIWQRTCQLLQKDEYTTQALLARFEVRVLCTTDDPADDLAHHHNIARLGGELAVYPTFRPDRALAVDRPRRFAQWVDRLALASGVTIASFDRWLAALEQRHQAFDQAGCRLSDHGLAQCFAEDCSPSQAAVIFEQVRGGRAASAEQHRYFCSFMMVYFAQLDTRRGWTKQLHLGPLRNVNTRLYKSIGADAGGDSIGDQRQVEALGRYLDRLDQAGALPKIIVYNINPADNYAIASMLGSFQGGAAAGALQLGSAWWFLDQAEGIRWHLNTLSNLGLLSQFVGMVTDSRSLLSLTRHEYFRRILCDELGRDWQRGEIPADKSLVGKMIVDICFANAAGKLGLAVPDGRQP